MTVAYRNSIEKVYTEQYDSYCKAAKARLKEFGEHAEDAVQEAFVRAMKYEKAAPKEGGVLDLARWIGTIVQNAAADIANKERRQGTTKDQYDEEEQNGPILDDLSHTNQKYEAVCNEMAEKMEPWNKILPLYFIEGLKSHEVAEIFDVSAANVRKVAQRFKEDMVRKYG